MNDSLGKIIGATRVKVMRVFLSNKGAQFSIDDVAKLIRAGKDSVKKEITLLNKVGFLLSKGKSRNKTYFLNNEFSYVVQLANLLLSPDESEVSFIRDNIKIAGSIKLIVLTGVFVPSEPEVGVDILIVGDRINQRKLVSAIGKIESALGRELRFVVFTTDDYKYRIDVQDKLLRDIFDYEHSVLIDKLSK